MKKTAFLMIVLAAIAFSARNAQAQLDPAGDPKFKVGDRVEYDSRQAMDPANAVWVKATVVRIEVAKEPDACHALRRRGVQIGRGRRLGKGYGRKQ